MRHPFNVFVFGWCAALTLAALAEGRWSTAVVCFVFAVLNAWAATDGVSKLFKEGTL